MAVYVSSSTAPQAKYYRDRAEQARRQVANASSAARTSFLVMADQWEGLANGIEATLRPGKRDEA